VTATTESRTAAYAEALPAGEAAARPVDDVLARMGSSPAGLTAAEAQRRAVATGPNAVRTHRARALPILRRQFRNAVLLLLCGTALLAFFLGDRTDAVVIGVILAVSIGLGFGN
jgi:Mg2+-importing ATPase